VRLFVALVIAVGAFSAVLGSAAGARAPKTHPLLLETTGRITAAGLSQIDVNGVKCTLDSKSAALAANFAVGENVRIGCLGKVLQTIKLEPISGGHAGPAITITGTPPVKVPTQLQIAVTSSQTANGAITAITAYSITIGDVTCPSSPQVEQLVGIGEVVSISCKTYADGDQLFNIAVPLRQTS